MHDTLQSEYPVLEEQAAQDLTVQAGALGVQALPGEVSRGWRMRSEDEAWTLVIMPDFFSIETTRYADWEDFKRRLEAMTQAVARSVDPSLEQRIGLRFIDRISHPEVASPKDWERWISPYFLGPIVHGTLGPGVETTQQIVQLDAGDGRNVIIRHGCYRDREATDNWVYVLDHDCYVQHGRPFQVAQIMDAVESLHTLALQVFQSAITPELLQYLRGENGAG